MQNLVLPELSGFTRSFVVSAFFSSGRNCRKPRGGRWRNLKAIWSGMAKPTSKSENFPLDIGPKSLFPLTSHTRAKEERWSERQDLNLRQPAPKAGALPS